MFTAAALDEIARHCACEIIGRHQIDDSTIQITVQAMPGMALQWFADRLAALPTPPEPLVFMPDD
jgi:hypothetical protein